jgi:hypothetical protein
MGTARMAVKAVPKNQQDTNLPGGAFLKPYQKPRFVHIRGIAIISQFLNVMGNILVRELRRVRKMAPKIVPIYQGIIILH